MDVVVLIPECFVEVTLTPVVAHWLRVEVASVVAVVEVTTLAARVTAATTVVVVVVVVSKKTKEPDIQQ